MENVLAEFVACRLAGRRECSLYFGRIGSITQPIRDSRGEFFVNAQTQPGELGLRTLHLPTAAISAYFYTIGQPNRTLYDVLGVPHNASRSELSLAFRLRCLETRAEGKRADWAVQRAYNLLGHPELRSCYDRTLVDRNAPVLFPYNGCGIFVARGHLSSEGDRLFVDKILTYVPELKSLRFRATLRRMEYVSGVAVYRDSQRRLTVYLDAVLFPAAGDPTWPRWRHLVGSRFGLNVDAVPCQVDGPSGHEAGAADWYTALPSRSRVDIPEGVVTAVYTAKRLWQRIGEHHDAIAALRERVTRQPMEMRDAEALCRSLGIPRDFDAAHLCWKPDYDALYYEQLKRRSRRTFLFREEYIFDLGSAVAVEVPERGHATYLFAAPTNIPDFLNCYAAASKDDIRRNRGNIAHRLAFIGRVMHGQNPKTWLREIGARTGAPLLLEDDSEHA